MARAREALNLQQGPRTDVSVSLRMLVLIRWVAVLGQGATILFVHYGLGFVLPVESALAVVATSAALNITVTWLRRRPARLGDREAALYLAYDILQLGVLLLLTGGLHNPFAILMLAPVTVSATVLSRRSVLGLSALFEGSSWWVAFRHFRRRKGSLGFMEAVLRSKDPTIFTVLFEDSAALIGLALAFLGILAAQLLEEPVFDGVASIAIGVLLALTAIFLAQETKSLLIGEPASARLQKSVLELVAKDPAIQRANGVLTVHLAPDQIVVALSAEFKDQMRTPEIEASVERIEAALAAAHPEIRMLFVKPQTAEKWLARRRRL